MSKKLKIQFWRAEEALAMQIIEQEGLPKLKKDGIVHITDAPWFYSTGIGLRGCIRSTDWKISVIQLDTNAERDAYLQKIVAAITDELFTEGELKVGEMCKVRNSESSEWEKRKLIAVLPKQYEKRFITEMEDYPIKHKGWDCARPIVKRTEPTIEECGQLVAYTWEEK